MSNLNDFVIENGVLKRYKGKDNDVVIPDDVTEIGNSAFYGCESLKSITIPDSVTKIEDFAFLECESLTSISIPDSVTEIGEEAFRDCKSLKSITIPEGVTEIGEFAFCNCESLTSITIPEGVTTIGRYAFHGGKGLTSIAIPESVTKIGEAAFWGCESLASITIPDSVTEIGENAFNECKSLTSITIPESVTAIGNWGFGFCTSLKEIVAGDISNIPNEDKFLAIIGFANSNGQGSEKRIESHKKYIKTNAAKLVNLAMKNISLLSLMCREKLITPKNLELYVQKATESKNTESIALMLDYSQTKITAKQKEAVEKKKEAQEEEKFERAIARSEKEGIKDLRFAATGYLSTFENRDKLKEFIVENGGSFSTTISSKVDYLIVNNPGMEIVKVKKAQEMGAEIITEREFNEKANRIFKIDGAGVLIKYMGAGVDVVIPKGVTKIGDSAFYGCKSLASITIPDGVTKIGNSAFRGCENLKSITIPESVTWIGEEAFYDCKGLADEKGFVILRGGLYGYFGKDKKVVIPDGVTWIGAWAFRFCKSLTSITIPDGVTWIGEEAFMWCDNLTSITIPGSVTWIEENAFRGCINLKEIVAEDISVVPTEYKILAIIGFVNSNGQGSEKRIESHKKYIKTNAAKLVDWAIEDINLLTLMCREKLLTPKNLELFVQKATQCQNAEATALMLDYSQTKVTEKKKEAVAKKKETATEEVSERTVARSAKDGIEGLCFAMAGKLKTFKNRDELKEIIAKNGGSFSTAVSAKVDYLITNDADTGDAKTKKAQAMGVEIITEYEFNEKINRVFHLNIAGVLVGYTGVGGDVVVPDGVTRIGGAAFIDCERLTSIAIPEGVTEVGQYVFSGCKNLTSITIPEGVTKIREYAFCGCESLTSITIPKSETKIGRNAFSSCESLTSITIPEGVTEIGKETFWGCKSLKIHAPAGSFAEEYAKENRIPFIAE